jgi:predicted transposase YbfD/YdcC
LIYSVALLVTLVTAGTLKIPASQDGATAAMLRSCLNLLQKPFISSLKPSAKRLNAAILQHWGIENKLHWMLDVAIDEDLSRKRAGHAAQNFSLLNRIALNLLKQDKTCKLGIHGKRLQAAWDHEYFLHLLAVDRQREN